MCGDIGQSLLARADRALQILLDQLQLVGDVGEWILRALERRNSRLL
jgi:hypothetical protein